jgi:hypothetical protein
MHRPEGPNHHLRAPGCPGTHNEMEQFSDDYRGLALQSTHPGRTHPPIHVHDRGSLRSMYWIGPQAVSITLPSLEACR